MTRARRSTLSSATTRPLNSNARRDVGELGRDHGRPSAPAAAAAGAWLSAFSPQPASRIAPSSRRARAHQTGRPSLPPPVRLPTSPTDHPLGRRARSLAPLRWGHAVSLQATERLRRRIRHFALRHQARRRATRQRSMPARSGRRSTTREPGAGEQRRDRIALALADLERDAAAWRPAAARSPGPARGRRPGRPARRSARSAARSRGPPARGWRDRRRRRRAGCRRSDRRRPRARRPSCAARSAPARRGPRRSALAVASVSASGLRSTPRPVACGSSESSASNRQPEPVPRSRIRSGALRSEICPSAASTTVSVSGRGISTAGETRNGRLQNSFSPRMYAIGSRARRRRTMSSSRRSCSAVRPLQAARRSGARARVRSPPPAAARPRTRASSMPAAASAR